MINAWQIRSFLLQKPSPDTIRLIDANDETMEISPGRRSKSKIAETIAATPAVRVELLDKDGKLIRATRLDEDMSPRSQKAPELPPGIETDPQALLLTHFANLVHRSYEHATDIAFSKLIDLVERMDARTESIEARLERTEANYRRETRERIEDAWDRADEAMERAESGEGKERILEGLVQGVVARANGNGAGNGAGKSNGRTEE